MPSSPTPPGHASGPSGPHRFGPRLAGPNARAVLGGALVAMAMLGAFALATGDRAPEPPERVVAARSLAPGAVLSADDLALAPVLLPTQVDEAAHGSIEALVGAVVLGPVGEGEIVQRAAVRTGSTDEQGGPRPELTVAMEPARALGGRLRPGERVDLLATYGSGADARTSVAAHDATVLDVQGADDGALGPSGEHAVTFEVAAEEVLAVAHAAEVGQLRLVRTTGTDLERQPTYRAPGPDDGGPALASERGPSS